MEVLSNYAIGLSVNLVYDFLKITIPKNTKKEIHRSFEKALKCWSKNAEIRKKERANLSELLTVHHILDSDYLNYDNNLLVFDDIPKTVLDFFNCFNEAVAQNNIAYSFLKDIRDRSSFRIVVNRLNDLSERIKEIDEKTSDLVVITKSVAASLHDKSRKELLKRLTVEVPLISKNKIIGRDRELQNINEQLFKCEKVVVINSMGGMGKSTLASVFTKENYDEYDHIVWVNVDGGLQKSVVNAPGLLSNLGISYRGEVEDVFILTMNALHAISSKKTCLLVLDNISDKEIKENKDYLPIHSKHWHVLATSRSSSFSDFETINLGVLTPQNALLLFRKYYTGNMLDDKKLGELLQKIEYHTLSLEILAKSAEESAYPFDRLLMALEDDLLAEIEVQRKQHGKVERITSYMKKIFDVSSLSEIQISVLKYFTCFPHEEVSRELVASIWFEQDAQKFADCYRCIGQLAKLGWLERNVDRNHFRLHRVIYELILEGQSFLEVEILPYISWISNKLKFDYQDNEDTPYDNIMYTRFGQSIQYLIDRQRIPLTCEPFGYFWNNLGLILRYTGVYNEAKYFIEKGILFLEKKLGVEHKDIAFNYSNLGLVLIDLKNFEDAKVQLEKAVYLSEINWEVNHSTTTLAYSNLALVHKELDEPHLAKELMIKVIKFQETNQEEDHMRLGTSYSNLAMILKDIEDFGGAKDAMKKAIYFDENNFGAGHPDTAISYWNLANILFDSGEKKSAISLSEKAYFVFFDKLGAEHTLTRRVVDKIALWKKDN